MSKTGNNVKTFLQKTQLKDTHAAIKTMVSWGLDVDIIGLWVDKNLKASLVK